MFICTKEKIQYLKIESFKADINVPDSFEGYCAPAMQNACLYNCILDF